jgi:hypothetical protein
MTVQGRLTGVRSCSMRSLGLILVFLALGCPSQQGPTPDGPPGVTGMPDPEPAPQTPIETEPQTPEPQTSACAKGGCSGTLCLEESKVNEIATTCEFKPEYACYRTASCERQANGQCGFTQTPELAACLKNPPPQ